MSAHPSIALDRGCRSLLPTLALFLAACTSHGYVEKSGGGLGESPDGGTGGAATGGGSGGGAYAGTGAGSGYGSSTGSGTGAGGGAGGATTGGATGTGAGPGTVSGAGGATTGGATGTGTGTGGGSTSVGAATTTKTMSAEVATILQGRCSGCHTYGQGDVAGWGSAMDLSRLIDADIVVPGDPNNSRMIDRIVVRGDMPPKGDRVPTAEVDKLRSWITSLRRPVVTPRTDLDILDAIAGDVAALRSMSSDFRYFSLAHFIDLGRPDAEVATARTALSFLVNSLSRKGTIISMVPVDSKESIYRVRLSDLGWSESRTR